MENFQSHEHSRLELHPGVNVVTGSSDSGKSALVRALVWLLKNRPQGFAFKSAFAKRRDSTWVGLQFGDGTWVERERGADENRYKASGGVKLEALRADVPDEIASILRLEDYNVQGQHDGYFLLQSSAGEVARMLNDVVGLDVIDRLLSRLTSVVNAAARDAERLGEEADSIERELSSYDFIDEAERAVARLGKLITDVQALASRRYAAQKVLAEYGEALEDIGPDVSLVRDELLLRDLEAAARRADLGAGFERLRVMRELADEYSAESEFVSRVVAEIEELSAERERVLGEIDRCPACGGRVDAEGRAKLVEFFNAS